MSTTLQQLVAMRYRAEAALARHRIEVFLPFVMRDEETHKPIKLAPMHRVWHQILSRYDRSVIWAHIESGKTQQISIGRVLFLLGKNPNLRIAIVSNTHHQAEKIVRVIARYIEDSKELHDVFPHLRPGSVWTSTQLVVHRARNFAKDYNVQAIGHHGNILGARLDYVVLDDILDWEITRTEKSRTDLLAWYKATLAGRLVQTGAVACIGTAFHKDDLMHELAKQAVALHGQGAAVRYPVYDDTTGAPRWPERWPSERIAKKQIELGPLEFTRQMLCLARTDAVSHFKTEDIERCKRKGEGRVLGTALAALPPGYRTYTGVDLAVQKTDAADLSALVTICVHPDGVREILEVQSGKWFGPEIIERIVDASNRWQSIVYVENNAAQDYIVQFTRGSYTIPIRGFTTGRNKAHPEFGVEGIAAEMAGERWIIPNENGVLHPEIAALVSDMLYYDPTTHTGDRLMACWFAREGARMGMMQATQERADFMSR